MFQKGKYIVYGIYGLCQIKDIGASPIEPENKRTYATLHPVYAPENSVIFTPVDNETVVKRLPISRQEAEALLKKAGDIPTLTVEREKQRREIYRAALQTAEPEQFISILRTVLLRRNDMSRMGRRLTDADIDYEKKARDNLVGELSLALAIVEQEASLLLESALGAKGLYAI